jgi:CheY-like chemotaxis protein
MPHFPLTERSFEVLLVDDELSTREILEQFCRSRGLAVTTAADGRAAITALERSPSQYALVLTDINMPGADGFDVLKATKAASDSCYVVMITGYATLDSALRAVREGAYDYLAKPFSLGQLDVLLARIKHLLALEEENRDLRSRLGFQGGRVAPPLAPPAAPTYAQPGRYPPPAYAPPAPVRLPAAPAPDISNRVGTMEDRLARMEELLQRAVGGRR